MRTFSPRLLVVAVTHADVAGLDFEVIARNNHSNEVDVIAIKEYQLEAQIYLEKKTHMITQSGWPFATTVSIYQGVATLEHKPWVIVAGSEVKSEKYGLMWMGLKSPEIFQYGSLVNGALKPSTGF